MTQIAVNCPDCSRLFVVNGRGRCACGAYLIHHWAGQRAHPLHLSMDGPVYWLRGIEWQLVKPQGWNRG